MRIPAILILFLLAPPALAQTLVATRTIRPRSLLTAADVTVVKGSVPGTLTAADQAAGQEARVVLYAGRPIRRGDVGPPAVVERNQIVPLAYHRGGLRIMAEGRALARAGAGETIRVMNTASHSTVTGVVGPDGTVTVGSQ